MKIKYLLTGVLAFSVIIGWNVFLAQRDQKLYRSYDAIQRLQQGSQVNLTPKEQYCKQQAGWHPDCNVE
jgi:hypothetical protein